MKRGDRGAQFAEGFVRVIEVFQLCGWSFDCVDGSVIEEQLEDVIVLIEEVIFNEEKGFTKKKWMIQFITTFKKVRNYSEREREKVGDKNKKESREKFGRKR